MSHARTVTDQRSRTGFVEHLFEKMGMFLLVLAVFGYGVATVFLLGPA